MCRSFLIPLFSLTAFATASISEIPSNQARIDSLAESIESKKGIDIGGTVRAVFLNSYVESPQDKNAVNTQPDREMAEFVQLDLDFKFRPWDAVTGNLLLRLGAGMQEYFAASATTVSVPWMNVEGQIGSHFYWVVGDFRQQYTPLTLYMPGVDIMYEPLIFARSRQMAQQDALVEGTQRNLQGLNLQFRNDFGSMLGEWRLEALLARIRKTEVLDNSGAMGNLLPNEDIAGAYGSSSFDKYTVAANLEAYPVNRNLMVGGTYMYLWDDPNTLSRTYFKNTFYEENYGNQAEYKYRYLPNNPWDSLAQQTHIVSARAGVDVAGLLGADKFQFDLTAEYALSNDKVYTEQKSYVCLQEDSEGVCQQYGMSVDDSDVPYDTLAVLSSRSKKENGNAVLIQTNLGYTTDSWMAKVSVDGLRNDAKWFNNLAQSNSFLATRVLNSDKDGNLSKYGASAPLYSSFDALYYYTPKHSPVATALANDDNAMKAGQTESYNIAPYVKNAYGSSVLTRKELELVNAMADPALQLALPNGLATSNRVGARISAVAGYGKNNVLEVQGLFTTLEQVKADAEKAKFTEYGGGAKLDVLGLIGFSAPLELSGSYKHSLREQGDAELNSDFINAGIFWRYFKRLGITAGFQMIETELNAAAASHYQQDLANLKALMVPVLEGKQTQWMVGLDYTLAPSAWLSLNYGQMQVKNTYSTAGLVDEQGQVDSGTSLPDYIEGVPAQANAKTLTHKFTRDIIQATINVEF